MDKILNFISKYENLVFVSATIILIGILIVILYVSKKFPWIAFVLTVLPIANYIVEKYVPTIQNAELYKKPLILYISGFYLLAIIFNFIILLDETYSKKSYYRFIKAIPISYNHNIYAYLNEYGRVTEVTNNFYKLFVSDDTKLSRWKKNIKGFIINDDELTYNEFINYVNRTTEKISVNVKLQDNEFPLELIKEPILSENSIIGYVLTSVQTSKLSEKLSLSICFDMFNEPISYFDKVSDSYIMSKQMARLLKQSSTIISRNTFTSLIISEDLPIYHNRNISPEKVNKYIFRLKTVNGIEWFEELLYQENSIEYDLIKRARLENFKFKFLSKNNLIEDLKSLFLTNDKFGLAIISLNSILKYNREDNQLSQLLISKYFNKLNETSLHGRNKVYKLGNIEYAIIFNNQADYDTLVRDLSNNISDLLSLDVFVNEIKYKLENSVGLVNALSINDKTPENLIKAGLDALYLATDVNYPKRFSIYFPSNNKDKDYRFEDCKIDLSDKFLDDLV